METAVSGGYQIARIRNIAAAELQDHFTVTVIRGDSELGYICYSPMNYCFRACNGGTDDTRLQNVAKALYAYSGAAKLFIEQEGE